MNEAVLKEKLQAMVRTLERDLHERLDEVPALAERLEADYRAAKASGRTGESLAAYREQEVTQAAVAWVLAAVFVRFLEDNGLLDGGGGGGSTAKRRYLAGTTRELVDLARDEERAYFRTEPSHGEREYLEHVFERVRRLPGMDRLFDRERTPLWRLGVSADGARALIDLFRQRDGDGEVVLTFDREDLDTRFLGDLYQDLSEATRKRYALLQTPDFVESFLLDRSLTPAVVTWGHDAVRLIDPACGSGHFLLGAFHRLLALHREAAPAAETYELVKRTLAQIAGVDLNPYAAAIARFRLLIAAIHACGIRQPAVRDIDFEVNVAAGDSLLHGRRPAAPGQSGELFGQDEMATPEAEHFFASEDRELLRKIFAERYHVVVANPPYITVKDSGLRALYRKRFPKSCSGQYSLVCPFMERLLDLTADGGHVAAIVGNAFMKRQFGKKLVEEVLPEWDLTHVIDTSGAHIPGHGTPTVILLARARRPATETIRTVMGIRGEPGAPEIPAKGKVWSAIVNQIDLPGSESEWVSVEDSSRSLFGQHPWTLRGGGQQVIQQLIEADTELLRNYIVAIGFHQDTHADEVFAHAREFSRRKSLQNYVKPHYRGENVRDWSVHGDEVIVFPFDDELRPWETLPSTGDFGWFWKLRSLLWARSTFGGQTYQQAARPWWDWHQFPRDRATIERSIALAFVATHNHFILDRGGRVFNRSAPVIKLPADATVDEHLGLIGLLNSSTACFWMKQVLFNKGARGQGGGFVSEEWEQFFEHDGTKLKQFPVPARRPLTLAHRLDELGAEHIQSTPHALSRRATPSRRSLDEARVEVESVGREMIAWQEELDWRCYSLYGLLGDDLTTGDEEPPPIELGERAFEIALARRLAAGEVSTTWFERHGSTPITEIPQHWSEAYRDLVQRRLDAIEQVKAIGLIERPEYKRRWSRRPWQELEDEALRAWLLDRLEAEDLWCELRLTSAAQLADRLRGDEDFRHVAALYRGREDFRMTRLISELVSAEGVPYLARQRYKPAGLRKRAQWEKVWELQRHEDALDARAALPDDDPDNLRPEEAEKQKAKLEIPVPPKYKRGDFLSATTWRLRGKLDVPKERFVLYPGAERAADPSPVLGWAGWDHLQRAQALAAAYVDARDQEAWSATRLGALLDGLDELMPWLLQWHDEHDPSLGMGLGRYFQGFVAEERRRLAERLQDEAAAPVTDSDHDAGQADLF